MGTLNLGTGAQFVGTTNGLSNAPTGTIIQTAINGTTNNITANADGSYKDLLSLSFTPRQSNSKIIFTIMFNAYYNNNNGASHGVSWRLLRDSTSIKEGTWTFYLHESGYTRDYYPIVSTFGFDEPGGTSAITYKIQCRTQGAGTVNVNRSENFDNSANSASLTSSITALEVSG